MQRIILCIYCQNAVLNWEVQTFTILECAALRGRDFLTEVGDGQNVPKLKMSRIYWAPCFQPKRSYVLSIVIIFPYNKVQIYKCILDLTLLTILHHITIEKVYQSTRIPRSLLQRTKKDFPYSYVEIMIAQAGATLTIRGTYPVNKPRNPSVA